MTLSLKVSFQKQKLMSLPLFTHNSLHGTGVHSAWPCSSFQTFNSVQAAGVYRLKPKDLFLDSDLKEQIKREHFDPLKGFKLKFQNFSPTFFTTLLRVS